MAKTKVRTTTKNIPKVKKMIDVTKPDTKKASGEAKNFYTRINRQLRETMKKSCIPALIEFGSDPNQLQNYFLNRKMYECLLGENLGLVDRAVITAITAAVADDIDGTIHGGVQKYPGIWDLDSIKALTRQFIRLVHIAGAVDGDTYFGPYDNDLTAKQWAEIQGENPETLFGFSEFNMQRLYEFGKQVNNSVMIIIADSMKRTPLAMYGTKDEIATLRYGREFADIIRPRLDIACGAEYGQLREQLEAILGVLSDSLSIYIGYLMSQSGLSKKTASMIINSTKWSAHYHNPENVPDAYNRDTTIIYVVKSQDAKPEDPAIFSITFKTMDIISLREPYNMLTKSLKLTIGRQLKLVLDSMTNYAFRDYVAKEIAESAQDSADADGEE